MSHSLDDFINYSNNNDNVDFLNKDFPNFDFDFAPPENTENDLFRNFPLNFPKTIQNVLDHDNNEANLGFIFNFDDVQPVVHQVPNTQERSQSNESYENFPTTEQTLSTCSPHTAEENEAGLNNGSKKITKREKAKLKAKAKQESLKDMLETVDKKYIPEGFYDPNLDEESKKKMIQVIRNRVSAQSSRDKKKNYVHELEQEKAELEMRNNKLAKENTILNEKLLNREIECKSLMEQIEALKKKEAAGCLKCGPTSDFGRSDTNDTNEITDESASVGSGASSPLLYRGVGGGRGRLFGFGATFTAFLCMMLVMYGTSDENGKKPTNLYNDKYVSKMPKDEVLHKVEKLIKSEEQPIQYREFDLEDTSPKVNRLKPLVERFEKTLDEVLAAYEKSQVVVDLANKKFDTPSKITSSNSSKSNSFLGKNNTQKAQKNATASIVLSNGYEVQKNESNMPSTTMTNTQFVEEVIGDDGMLQKGGSLDIEKAEYVQLFVPKSALGQIGGPQNLDFGNLPTLKEEGENNSDSLLEIWCKIFAIRDASEAI